MALNFDGLDIPGVHGPLNIGGPELVARRFKVFQIRGEGEIRGKPGGRSFSVRALIYGKFTGAKPGKLLAFLEKLELKIGVNGTLDETGNVERTLDYCTFDGWEPIPNEGQQEPGPLFDVAGALEQKSNGTPIYGWFAYTLLHFRQLRTNQ